MAETAEKKKTRKKAEGVAIHFRLPQDVYDALQAAANDDMRSVGNLCEVAARKYAKQLGEGGEGKF